MCADILSRKNNRFMMKKYTESLCRRGFGPRRFDPYRYRQRRRLRESEDAGADNVDGDNMGSDEENET